MATTKISNSGFAGTKYDNLSADNNYMETIASTLVGAGGTSSITFSNIPQGYKHLQIRIIARTTRTSYSNDYMLLRFNGDSGSNYSNHALTGTGGSAGSIGYASQTASSIQRFAGNAMTANAFGVAIIDILDYTNTSKYKTLRNIGATDDNDIGGTAEVGFYTNCWMNTAPITSMVFTTSPSANITQNSRISIYGIKG